MADALVELHQLPVQAVHVQLRGVLQSRDLARVRPARYEVHLPADTWIGVVLGDENPPLTNALARLAGA
ncbi:hypothetical protein G6F63_017003 [Rhizopus arrhizus]|nr:hypothetical protein G6F63_017003 [Rhizopus arrhizus]